MTKQELVDASNDMMAALAETLITVMLHAYGSLTRDELVLLVYTAMNRPDALPDPETFDPAQGLQFGDGEGDGGGAKIPFSKLN